jgi:hypothetical protein
LERKAKIVATESKWGVDRRAIAGAIAWEAMDNYQSSLGLGMARFSGPGKVHYKDNRILGEGSPLSKELEDRGILPKQSEDDRKKLLATDDGALDYIGASMRAFIDIAAPAGYDLNEPQYLPALVFMYNSWHLEQAEADFKTKKAPAPFDWSSSDMAVWFEKKQNRAYVEAIVSAPGGPLKKPGSP